MKNLILIAIGKTVTKIIRTFNLGNGSTWPGHLALLANSHFIKEMVKDSGNNIIFVVGTNGKTTTTSLIRHLLETNNTSVIQNISGANLLNGIASTLLLNASWNGKIRSDIVLLEIDENAFTLALTQLQPDYILILNLFRDQLDRYGEVATIARKWKKAITSLPENTTLILNADDPQIAYIGTSLKNNVKYFGIREEDKTNNTPDHASDSTYCPECGAKLQYKTITYSHLGIWDCPKCSLTRPQPTLVESPIYPLSGTYNTYNTNAAVLLTKTLGLTDSEIKKSLLSFKPVFGRQEEIEIDGKKAVIFLAKNPTGFNETLRTISKLDAKHVLFILNDNIADGTDVSWIWDIDMEDFVNNFESITVSGERVYDMALRIKYAYKSPPLKAVAEPNLKKALTYAISNTSSQERLYIVPTYTAMLQLREIITGKKIL